MEQVWRYKTGSEILHSLTLCGGLVAAGDADGRLHLLDARVGGVPRVVDLGEPLFGGGVFVDGVLCLGDANGVMHAIDLAGGAVAWSTDAGEYAFESKPAHHAGSDLLIVGAWDGMLYAVERSSGRVVWSGWCPTGQAGKRSRYYAAADCPPAVVGDEVWVTDRGYRLARYRVEDGEPLGEAAENVSGVAAYGGGVILARGLEGQLTRYRPGGEVVWAIEAPLGRSPRPPAYAAGIDAAAVVSDTGLLTVVDGASGERLLEQSVAPGLFVHSGLSYSARQSAWYTAAMDGVVTRTPHARGG